ncbi:MAG: bifunctional DNA-formamidopyrimidine glycosylase/DNA-(apurinic or apyrimidinic site) lyase [Candidatus Microsyncoccus archaeolyticus]|nr:MAG: bifunctional DNA-formamidopyrimidine glycosylase/DNA-(apurinic or apyrimidinic site) lyase [Candidatus Parcubacteria bacterium]
MPELPEVETIVRGLEKKVLKRTFLNIWTDSKKLFKGIAFNNFVKKIKGKKIKNIRRRGKNILFDLSEGLTLLIHQKITGHLLIGKWGKKDNKYISLEKGAKLNDPINQSIRVVFFFDKGIQMALSDLRKFAKIELKETEEIEKELSVLGPEPLEINFKEFKELFLNKKGVIKQVLMNQNFIVGIGNIYANDILWEAKISPKRRLESLKEEEIEKIYSAMKRILNESIKLKGDSFSDFRTISGEKGGYHKIIRVYGKEGEKCKCGGTIRRIKQGGRSSFFCPNCQK